MIVQRTEKHILQKSKELNIICGNSKNLYNYCNYILRQSYIKDKKLPSEYDISKQLTKEKQMDWVKMGANTNQQVLKLLYKNWKSYFKAIKEYYKNPGKFLGKPKIPKYKDKNGKFMVNFPCSNKTNIKQGFFHFPKFTNLNPIKTQVINQNLCQCRIIPQASCYIVEIIYELEVPDPIKRDNSYLSIDLGVNNFATCFDNSDNSSFIIKGEVIKSYNQYYNKKKSELQSQLKIINNRQSSKRLNRLSQKRNNKINDFMHKASHYIVNYCLQKGIWNIIVGHNKEWKQDINIGKTNNQKFTSIPFNKFINQLKYKCENYGINFIITEESYTSKIDHFVLESMEYHDEYLGKRIHRGLFKSSTNQVLNADVNGSLGILRKVIDESSFKKIINRGLVTSPNKINIYSI